jgi:hypothetical protein
MGLGQRAQTAPTPAHADDTARKSSAYARRHLGYRAASAATSAVTSAGSTRPVMRICGALVKQISIVPGPATAPGDAPARPAGSGVTVTDTKVGAAEVSGKPASAPSCLRQANSMLGLMPSSRATDVTVIPGENVAATAASFSPRVQRRRGGPDISSMCHRLYAPGLRRCLEASFQGPIFDRPAICMRRYLPARAKR